MYAAETESASILLCSKLPHTSPKKTPKNFLSTLLWELKFFFQCICARWWIDRRWTCYLSYTFFLWRHKNIKNPPNTPTKNLKTKTVEKLPLNNTNTKKKKSQSLLSHLMNLKFNPPQKTPAAFLSGCKKTSKEYLESKIFMSWNGSKP